MLRSLFISAAKLANVAVSNPRFLLHNAVKPTLLPSSNVRSFGSLLKPNLAGTGLLVPNVQPENVTVRTVTKFSFRTGKRKAVKAVLRRFYRLNWGIWIRTKCGRHKKLWKKSPPRKRRLRQHVFCNATQSTLLDKMVTNFWRKPKYYVDDPYEPYHTREEWKLTYSKPRPYFPPE